MRESTDDTAAAAQGEQLHRQIFEKNLAVQLLIDPADGRILSANPAAARFYGYSRDRLTTMRISEINVLSPEEISAAMQRAVSERQNAFRFRHRLASGEVRDVEVHSGPVEIDGRQLLYSIIHDVTERRRAEDALAEREASFRLLFDSHPHPMWVYALDDLRFLEVNRAAVQTYGWSREEFLALRITDIRPPEDVPRVLEAVERLRQNQPNLNRVWRHRARSGALMEMEITSHPVQLAGRRAALVTARNLTEQRRSEEALRESEERFRRVVEMSPDGIVIHAGGRITFANRAAVAIAGATEPGQVEGRSIWDFVHADSREPVRARLEGLAAGRAAPLLEETLLRLDGRPVTVEVGAMPFMHRGEAAVQVVIRDITARKHSERLQSALYRIAQVTGTLQDMDAFYAAIHGIVGELMYAENFYIALQDELTRAIRFAYFVDQFDKVPPEVKPGKTLTEFVLRTGTTLLASPSVFNEMVERGEVESVGEPSVDWLGVPLRRGERTFGVLVVQSYEESRRFSESDRDVLTFVAQHVATAIDRKRAADALRESETRFRTLAETAPCAIFIYQGSNFVYANPAMSRISGYSREELVGMNFWDLVHPDHREIVRGRGEARQRGESVPPEYEFKIIRRGGEVRWVDFSAGTIEYDGQPAALGTAFDITARKQAEEQIKSLAYHDTLTGLPNRLLLNDRLGIAVAQAHRIGARLSILFLDVDRFKVINDSLGHSVGDRVLMGVAGRLQRCVREGDTVARLGGDEFTVLLPGIHRAVDAAKVAEKIREALRHPFRVDGRELFVTASMGISVYPEDGTDAETLVKNADTAMYRAKEQGRDNYQLYTPAMNATAVERLHLESNLRKAVAQQELMVYYQPLLDLATGRVHGLEALLRWRDPERGLIPPSEFISLAEITGLILPMGTWVLRTACRQARLWQEMGHPHLHVSVNLSARQFQQPDLVAQVRHVLDDTGIHPRYLDLEITESSAMQNADATVFTLRELKALGVRISIDDFGIGYSSLSYLKRLPIDSLKIDQSFVRDITTDPDDAAIATAVIALAHTLKLKVVAEGVENEEQLAFLADRSCDRMQGFLFSHPLPPDECEAFLLAHRRLG